MRHTDSLVKAALHTRAARLDARNETQYACNADTSFMLVRLVLLVQKTMHIFLLLPPTKSGTTTIVTPLLACEQKLQDAR